MVCSSISDPFFASSAPSAIMSPPRDTTIARASRARASASGMASANASAASASAAARAASPVIAQARARTAWAPAICDRSTCAENSPTPGAIAGVTAAIAPSGDPRNSESSAFCTATVRATVPRRSE